MDTFNLHDFIYESSCESHYDLPAPNSDPQLLENAFFGVPPMTVPSDTTESQDLSNSFLDSELSDNIDSHQTVGLSIPPQGSKHRRRRFTTSQNQCLNSWLQSHRQPYYPKPEDKRILAARTGLTERQIQTWFNNERNRKHMQCKTPYC